jgi:hypothetical protein
MLGWYQGLMPAADRISALVSVRIPGRRPSAGFNGLAASVADGRITLRIGDREIPGEVRSRVGDRIAGTSFWVTFHFNDEAREALSDFAPAFISVNADGYCWDSDPLSDDVRQSLCNDLSRG